MNTSVLTDPNVLLTSAIAIATVANVIVSRGLWKATLDSVRISEKALDASTRPLIAVVSTTASVDQARLSWNFHVQLRNFGSVPALAVQEEAVLLVGGQEIGVSSPRSRPYVLVPGTTPTIILRLEETKVMEEVLKRQKILEIATRISYRDSVKRLYSYYEKDAFDIDVDRFYTVENAHIADMP